MKKGVCKKGHRLTPENTFVFEQKIVKGDEVTFVEKHQCHRCRLRYQAKRRREDGIAKRRLSPSVCPSGHPFTPENTIETRRQRKGVKRATVKVSRQCRECHQQANRLYRERKRERTREALTHMEETT